VSYTSAIRNWLQVIASIEKDPKAFYLVVLDFLLHNVLPIITEYWSRRTVRVLR